MFDDIENGGFDSNQPEYPDWKKRRHMFGGNDEDFEEYVPKQSITLTNHQNDQLVPRSILDIPNARLSQYP